MSKTFKAEKQHHQEEAERWVEMRLLGHGYSHFYREGNTGNRGTGKQIHKATNSSSPMQ